MKPFFSIIIPTLNEERYLPKLLQALQKQLLENFEVIIIDGSSNDATVEKALQFKANFSACHILTVEKRNVSYQRNLGAEKAKGKYLLFLDADTNIYPTFTKKLQQTIHRKGGLFFLPSLIADERSARNTLIFSIVNAVIEASQSIGTPIPVPSATFIEKQLFFTIGKFNEALGLGEDHDLLLRARRWGITGKFLRDVKVIFSMRRVRKEGEIKLLTTYFSSTIQMLLYGKFKEGKRSKYEMGGHIFSNDKLKKPRSSDLFL